MDRINPICPDVETDDPSSDVEHIGIVLYVLAHHAEFLGSIIAFSIVF